MGKLKFFVNFFKKAFRRIAFSKSASSRPARESEGGFIPPEREIARILRNFP
jgi:hypothetical protein